MGDEVLTLHQAAEELGVHYMTAYRYVRHGMLEGTKVDGSWQVTRREVERLAAQRRGGPGARVGAPAGAPWSERLESRLRAGDEPGSWGVVEAALGSGMQPATIHLEVLVPALTRIGDAWATGELDVAVEHRASVIAMRLLGRLGPRFSRRGQVRGTVVLGAPPGDLHGLPTAILADLVRGAGFAVVDLGADVPAASFVTVALGAERLRAVAVGATTAGNDEAVRSVADGLHRALPGVPVLIGGGAVADAAHAHALGADGWAPDAAAAVRLLEELAAAP